MSGRFPVPAAPVAGEPVVLRDVVVIGGGCYGSFYAGQLLAARERENVSYRRVLVVDRNPACRMSRQQGNDAGPTLVLRDWDDFLAEWLADDARDAPGPPDVIVPSPLMPHLMYRWLLRRARERWPGRRVETRPVPQGPGTPYDTSGPDHTRYVSFADWICPTHCIEPANCPVIRGPRTWEMAHALERLLPRLASGTPVAGPVLLRCRHTVFGVGTFPAAEVRRGDRLVAEVGARGGEVEVLVGTISSCHGALNLLHLGEV